MNKKAVAAIIGFIIVLAIIGLLVKIYLFPDEKE